MAGRAGEGVDDTTSPKSHFSCCVIANGGIIFDGAHNAGRQAQ